MPEEFLQADDIAADRGIDLAIGALEIGVGDHPWATVTGAANIDRVEIPRLDQPVQVRVEEIQPGRCAPVAEQPRFDVLDLQRLA